MRILWILVIVLLTLAFAGCVPSQPLEEDLPPSDPQVPPMEASITNMPETPLEPNETPEVLNMPTNAPPVAKFVDLAKSDLLDRLQIDQTSIDLIKTEETVWPNAALGCPEPGKFYAQGRVPGFRIWLVAGGVEYNYHTDWLGKVILCIVPGLDVNTPPPADAGPTSQIGVPIK